MAYNGYDKVWLSEFYNNVSPKDRAQDFNLNQFKLKVNDTLGKDEKITTNFEQNNNKITTDNDEDVINKTVLG